MNKVQGNPIKADDDVKNKVNDDPQMPQWKAEVSKKKLERERTMDVENRWERAINSNGEGAPDWMKETAMRKKAQRDSLTKSGIPPWMQETQRRNSALTKKIIEAKESALDGDISERDLLELANKRRQSAL